jgi:hypothetical protein
MDGRAAAAQGKAFPGDPGAAAGRPSQPITEVELEAVYTRAAASFLASPHRQQLLATGLALSAPAIPHHHADANHDFPSIAIIGAGLAGLPVHASCMQLALAPPFLTKAVAWVAACAPGAATTGRPTTARNTLPPATRPSASKWRTG